MKSKTLFWNKSVGRYFINNIVWLALIYFIGLLLIHIPSLINNSAYIENVGPANPDLDTNLLALEFFREMSAGQHLFTLILVTIIVITQFDYKNHEASSDFIHALPIKRIQILTQGIIIGQGILFALTAVVGIVIYLMTFSLSFEIPFVEIIKWTLYSWFVIFITYSFTIFVGMFVKRAVLQALFTAAAMLLPLITWTLNNFVAMSLLEGTPNFQPLESQGISAFFEAISFPIHIIDQLQYGYSISILYWVIAGIVLIALTYILYNRHHVERVSSSFYYSSLHILLTAWLSVLGMLVFGTFMYFIFANLIVTFIGYVIGLALSYLIIEMILQFTPRIKFSLKTMIATVVLAILFWIAFIFGWNAYLQNSPDLEKIDGVTFNTNNYYIEQFDELKEAGIIEKDFALMTSESDINELYNLHQEILDNRDGLFSFFSTAPVDHEYYNYANFIYRLENGEMWTRSFHLSADEEDVYNRIMKVNEKQSSDILENILKPEAVYNLGINMFSGAFNSTDKVSTDFAQSYKEYADNNTHKLSKISDLTQPTLALEISFSDDDNHYWIDAYGHNNVDIYNQATKDYLLKGHVGPNDLISASLGLSNSDDVYLVDVDGELDAFVEAVNTQTIGEVNEQFNFEKVEGSDFKEIMALVDEAKFDGDSDQILVYGYPYSSAPGESILDEYANNLFSDVELFVLGIEEE